MTAVAPFIIQPYQCNLHFPFYSEPKEIGNFSLDQNRKYCHDKRELKYLRLPERLNAVYFDLNISYDLAVKISFDASETMIHLLRWMVASKDVLGRIKTEKNNNTFGDFVCLRRILTTILCTPYEERESWIICATKFKGTIYLCQFETPEKKLKEANMTERDRLMSSWGYKFEQYMAVDKPNDVPNPNIPVNELRAFYSVVRTQFENYSLLFGAEIDCVDAKQVNSNSMSRYYELKTSRHMIMDNQVQSFKRYKLLKWWAQSFLAGLEHIICGFRDDYGIVYSLKLFSLKEILKQVEGLWNPNVCMNFCLKFLHFLRNTVAIDDPKVVYKFEWKPGNPVRGTVFTRPTEYTFLPSWFIDEFTNY